MSDIHSSLVVVSLINIWFLVLQLQLESLLDGPTASEGLLTGDPVDVHGNMWC